MVAAANRFLSKLFLLSKATLGAIFSTAERLERPTWQWQVLRLPMACERVQFSKKTHGDGAGIVRKLDANRKRIPATCASSGQSKTILARS
jgi:hypothetical protein